MSLKRLKWGVVLAAAVFLLVLEYTRHVLAPVLLSWPGTVLLYAVPAGRSVSLPLPGGERAAVE